MAKKKEEKSNIVLERIYNVPLRKEFQKVPRYKRAKKAVKALKEFLSKHMKSDNIKLKRHLNMKVWENGIKNPPHHVNVKVEKFNDGSVIAELVGAPAEKTGEKKKKEEEKTEKDKEKENKKKEEKSEKDKGKTTEKEEKKKDDTKEVKKIPEKNNKKENKQEINK